ncbi:PIN domain-containing protein [Chryseobacterium shandongense]|uniref:PIN domain-containing protein n=1 Tax=Chryseobacterium shandongense TaxID=1493872 RepID=UPI000F4ED379|nr:PIN domain-containing protein [Chryseobacterium shandongense]AZA56347.1 hypothetical protein EG350_03700 [Chryseobacterium shandongense]
MKILIDSTTYKQDKTLNKSDFSLLKDLGKKKLIEISIPWVVYKEATTSSVQESQNDFQQAINKLIALDKKGVHPNHYNDIITYVKKLNELKIDFEESVKRLWDEFIKDSNAILHPFNPKHSTKVFENYFSGGEPFKSLKNRDDIPDAFIYALIKDISRKNKLVLISNDTNLSDKCGPDKNILIFKTLKDFYSSTVFESINEKYKSLLKVEKYNDTLQFLQCCENVIKEEALSFANSISHIEFEEPSLKSENNEGTIIGYGADEARVKWQDAKNIAEQIFLPIEVSGLALIDYFIFKSDYWMYENRPQIADDWNEHFYRVEQECRMTLFITLNFNIEQMLEMKKNDEELELQINSFDTVRLD